MIFVLTTLPVGRMRQHFVAPRRLFDVLQNMFHIPLYAGLAWLLFAGRGKNAELSMSEVGAATLTAMTVAVVNEWVQSWLPRRTTSLSDLGLDLLGILSVVILLWSQGATRRA
jgi:VanZ family protein